VIQQRVTLFQKDHIMPKPTAPRPTKEERAYEKRAAKAAKLAKRRAEREAKPEPAEQGSERPSSGETR
jgi:hypothetical protein